jgi:hypothetical protein
MCHGSGLSASYGRNDPCGFCNGTGLAHPPKETEPPGVMFQQPDREERPYIPITAQQAEQLRADLAASREREALMHDFLQAALLLIEHPDYDRCETVKGRMTRPMFCSALRGILSTPPAQADKTNDAEDGMPEDLHPATRSLVRRFSFALAHKLQAAEQKYGYSDGWRSADWMDECRAKLREHLEKGDPRDVANYCAFLWHHGESTKKAPQTRGGTGDFASC